VIQVPNVLKGVKISKKKSECHKWKRPNPYIKILTITIKSEKMKSKMKALFTFLLLLFSFGDLSGTSASANPLRRLRNSIKNVIAPFFNPNSKILTF